MVRGQPKNGWNGVLGRRNSMITGPVVGGAGHIPSSKGRPGWPECVCSMGPLVPVCLPCWCLFRVTVCLFPSPAGFAPSFPATEAFSTFWSAITTQATTSISESGALTPRPSRCRASAGSSSEQGAGAAPRSERVPVWTEELGGSSVPTPLPPPAAPVNPAPM